MNEKWLEYDTTFKSKLDRVINNSVGQRIECEVVRQLSVKKFKTRLECETRFKWEIENS